MREAGDAAEAVLFLKEISGWAGEAGDAVPFLEKIQGECADRAMRLKRRASW